MLRDELVAHLEQLLQPQAFKDYCPNGLQVEGRSTINKIITGVSCNLALIEAAIAVDADAIITHHGLFWHKSEMALTGLKYRRVAELIRNEINLLAYHLPLDNHSQLGNNVQLAKLLALEVDGQCGEQDLLWYGHCATPCTLSQLVSTYEKKTQHSVKYFGAPERQIAKVAWCTGGADSMFEQAIRLGVDVFITGEVSEPIMHLALESGVAFVAAGHYVSERYGILALTNYLINLGIDAQFIDLYNPI